MKILSVRKISKNKEGVYSFPIVIGKGSSEKTVDFSISSDDYEKSLLNPLYSDLAIGRGWLYKNYVLLVDEHFCGEDNILEIKHFVLKREKELEEISKEIEIYENSQEK